jgi:hypothetical protein
MNWNQIVEKVKPYIVMIKTPTGSGTGFLCLYSADKTWCGIATALHVINDANEWRQPIKLVHQASKNTEFFLENRNRTILDDPKTDSAVILFEKPEDLLLPNRLIPLRPLTNELNIGSEVGWLGYPYLEENTICFFSGNISARNEQKRYYLVDGVAINGVSGGPVLFSSETEGIEIIGTISAYIANRATGSSLPGLSVAQDVSHFISCDKVLQEVDRKVQEKNKYPVNLK